MPPGADLGFDWDWKTWRTPYFALPKFCCGTTGFSYGIEYIVDVITGNYVNKEHRLILIFPSVSAKDRFKNRLYLKLKEHFFEDDEIKKKHSYCEFKFQNGPLHQIHILMKSSKYVLETRIRGLAKEFKTVQMSNF